MLSGMIVMIVAFGLFYYFTNAKPGAERFKKEHPLISVGLMLTGGYTFVYMIGGVLVLVFGTLLPIFGNILYFFFVGISMSPKKC